MFYGPRSVTDVTRARRASGEPPDAGAYAGGREMTSWPPSWKSYG